MILVGDVGVVRISNNNREQLDLDKNNDNRWKNIRYVEKSIRV